MKAEAILMLFTAIFSAPSEVPPIEESNTHALNLKVTGPKAQEPTGKLQGHSL